MQQQQQYQNMPMGGNPFDDMYAGGNNFLQHQPQQGSYHQHQQLQQLQHQPTLMNPHHNNFPFNNDYYHENNITQSSFNNGNGSKNWIDVEK